MVASVKVLDFVTQALTSGRRGNSGVLVGFTAGSETVVLSAAACAPDDYQSTKGAPARL